MHTQKEKYRGNVEGFRKQHESQLVSLFYLACTVLHGCL